MYYTPAPLVSRLTINDDASISSSTTFLRFSPGSPLFVSSARYSFIEVPTDDLHGGIRVSIRGKKEKRKKRGEKRGTKERSARLSEIDVHSVADSRFCNILFGAANTERTNHFSQLRNRGPFPICTPVFSLVFCFLSVHRAWHDHRLSNFIENVVSITRNPYFIFIGWIPTRNFYFSIFTHRHDATCNSSNYVEECRRKSSRPLLFRHDRHSTDRVSLEPVVIGAGVRATKHERTSPSSHATREHRPSVD